MSAPFKIAFIGSHGVGKTTLCYGLAARLKAADFSLEVVGEVARRCPLPINRETTIDAQTWILHTQIAEEILAQSRGRVVICDRSVLDNYVYLLLAAGTGVRPEIVRLVDEWTKSYDLLIRVPILQQPNPDGLRSTDPNFQREVDSRLGEEIERRGLEVLDLSGSDRQSWVGRAEETARLRLRPAQLQLPKN